ncbi:MAG: CapA family protein [Planctomycetes bacterium]|nr:CapA family protein [Planctomycetota bacterium]
MRRWRSWSAALFFLVALARCASTESLSDSGGDVAPDAPFRLLLLGDTSFGESYQARRAEKGEENILQTRGYDDCLLLLTPLLARADRVVANLETPVTMPGTPGSSPLAGKKDYINWADSERTPATLAKHGITAVSLANNHAMDYGRDGLSRTLDALRARGIEYFGAGLDEDAAARPLVIETSSGMSTPQIVIAAGFEYRRSYEELFHFYAISDAPGAPGVNNWRPDRATEQIADLRKKYPDAILIAYPHWGSNYAWRRTRQADLGRAIIDAGADLVIGHGSHTLQEIELYQGRWIINSLGNFVFNSPGRYKAENCPPYSFMAMLELRREGEGWGYTIRLYPIFSDNRISDYHPRPVTASEFRSVRNLLRDRGSMPGIETGEDRFGHYLEVNSTLAPLPP